MIRRFVVMSASMVAAVLLSAQIALGASASVSIGDNFYDPATVTISAGDSVVWTNNGQAPHTVTADDGSFDSSPDCPGNIDECMQSGDTYSHTFGSAGTFTYYCKVHGQGMSGTVVVQGGATSGTSPGPNGTLPNTGPEPGTLPLGLIGIGLLVGGGVVLFLLRRRRA
jgi:plastocyanin